MEAQHLILCLFASFCVETPICSAALAGVSYEEYVPIEQGDGLVSVNTADQQRLKGCLFATASVEWRGSCDYYDMRMSASGESMVPAGVWLTWLQAAARCQEMESLLSDSQSWVGRKDWPKPGSNDFSFDFAANDTVTISVTICPHLWPNREVLSDEAITNALREHLETAFEAWMINDNEVGNSDLGLRTTPLTLGGLLTQ